MSSTLRAFMVTVVIRHGLLLAALLLVALLPTCVPAATPIAPEPATSDVPCTDAFLASFDPDSEVAERGPLPPMEQATEAHTEELVTLPCEEGEDEPRCLERAEAQVKEAYPSGTITEAAIGVDKEVVRAELVIDTREEVVTAESLPALAEIITKRRNDGEPVVVAQAERVPAPDAQRSAVIRVRLPGQLRAREALRAYLVLVAPTSPVRTMLELQVRAAQARLFLRAVEPQPDGTIRVEIGCERALDPEAQGISGQDDGATSPGS